MRIKNPNQIKLDTNDFFFHEYKDCLNFYTGEGDQYMEVSLQAVKLAKVHVRRLQNKDDILISLTSSYDRRREATKLLEAIENSLQGKGALAIFLTSTCEVERALADDIVNILSKRGTLI